MSRIVLKDLDDYYVLEATARIGVAGGLYRFSAVAPNSLYGGSVGYLEQDTIYRYREGQEDVTPRKLTWNTWL